MSEIKPFEEVNYLAEARERSTIQFEDAVVFNKYLQLLLSGMDVQAVFKSLMQNRSIDTAVGAQLDILGNIVGQPREFISTDMFDFFAFEGYPAAGPYGDLFGSSEGGTYYSLGDPLSGNTILNDEQYRLFIKAKIAKNVSRSTPDEILEFISFVFDVQVNNLVTEGVGEFTILVGRELSRFERELLSYRTDRDGYESYFVPKPAGVRIRFGQFPSENYFGFQGAPGAKGYGDLNDPSVGGQWATLF